MPLGQFSKLHSRTVNVGSFGDKRRLQYGARMSDITIICIDFHLGPSSTHRGGKIKIAKWL